MISNNNRNILQNIIFMLHCLQAVATSNECKVYIFYCVLAKCIPDISTVKFKGKFLILFFLHMFFKFFQPVPDSSLCIVGLGIEFFPVSSCGGILKQIITNVVYTISIVECSQRHFNCTASIPCTSFKKFYRFIEPDKISQLFVSIRQYVWRCICFRERYQSVTRCISQCSGIFIPQINQNRSDVFNLVSIHTMSIIDCDKPAQNK